MAEMPHAVPGAKHATILLTAAGAVTMATALTDREMNSTPLSG